MANKRVTCPFDLTEANIYHSKRKVSKLEFPQIIFHIPDADLICVSKETDYPETANGKERSEDNSSVQTGRIKKRGIHLKQVLGGGGVGQQKQVSNGSPRH